MDPAPEWLVRLEARLRASSFRIGTGQHLDARQVLARLRARPDAPADAEALAPYLAPIYCASADQQAAFESLLKQAWGVEAPAPKPPPATAAWLAPAWRRWWPTLLMLLALALLAGTGVHLLRGHDVELRVFRAAESGPQATPAIVRTLSTGGEQPTDPNGRLQLHLSRIQLPISVSVRALEGGESREEELKSLPTATWDITLPALAPKEPDPPPPPAQGFRRLFAGTPLLPSASRPESVDEKVWSRSHLLLLALPVVIAVLWSAYWALRRRAWLTRLPKQQAGRLRELSSRARQTLNAALDGGRAAHELRRRRWQPSAALNLEATLRASVERPQAPTLVFGSRVEPEYLVLIDESSSLDHLARLADELMLSLQARDVALARYFFTDSPLWCHGPAEERQLRKPGLPEVALEALQGSHGGHRLIVVSDGRPLFHAGTGAPMPCMEQLLRWPDPVLLTPTRRERWGRREWALSRQGFTVLPLNADGLRLLGELQGSDRPVPPPGAEAAGRPPPRWVLEPLSLLLPTPPTGVTPAALCDELQAHLGEDAFIWLQGCAIYPEIHWGITLRIGAGLLGTDARLARALVPLVRLPWLRDSHMPNWLREALRARMTPPDWAQVSRVIDQILDSVSEDRQGDIPLQIATPAGTPGLLQRLRQRWQAWRRATRAPSSPPSREAPVPPARRLTRDPVFLRFLQGPPSLGVPAADALRRLFFTDGLWTLGTKALPLMVVALIASAGLAWQFPPRQVVPHLVDRPPAVAPAVTALAVEPGASAPGVLVAYDNSELWRVEAAGATRQATLKSIAITGLQVQADGRRLLRLGSDRSVTLPARPLASGSEAELDLEVGRLFSGRDGRQTARLAADGRSLEVAQAGSAPRRMGLPASGGAPLCVGVGSGNTVAIASARNVDMLGIVGDPQIASVPLPATAGCVLPPDGATMFGWQAPSGGRVAVWRLDLRRRQMGTPLSLAGTEPIVAAAASADGRLLWLLRGNTVEAFDGSSGASLGTLPTSATQLATSADGLLLALSSPGGQIELWQRDPLPALATRAPQKFLLAISQEYPDSQFKAERQHQAATALGSLLTQRYGYRATYVRDPDRAGLDAAFVKLSQTLEADDQVVVYLNGRAAREDAIRELFVALRDTDTKAKALFASELSALLGRLPARQVLLIAEVSQGRLLGVGKQAAPGVIPGTRLLLSSAGQGEDSFDNTAAQPTANPMMNALIGLLEQAPGPTLASALPGRINDIVSKISGVGKQTAHLDPLPQAGHTGGDFSFVPLTRPKSAAVAFTVRDQRLIGTDGQPVRYVAATARGGSLSGPQLIALHATATADMESYVRIMTSPKAAASVHLAIGRDGSVVQFAPFNEAVQALGNATWRGQDKLNGTSINVDFVNVGALQSDRAGRWRDNAGGVHQEGDDVTLVKAPDPREGAWQSFTPEQLRVGRQVVQALLQAYPTVQAVVGHDELEPVRRTDPGPAFPMADFRTLRPETAPPAASPAASVPAPVPAAPPAASQAQAVRQVIEPGPAAGRLHVLAVGISQYQDIRNLPPLAVSTKGTLEFVDLMKRQEGRLYKEVRTRVLIDGEATLRAVRQALGQIQASAASGDTAVIYLSGYSSSDRLGRFAFLPVDANGARPDESAIVDQYLSTTLASLRGRGVLLLDTFPSNAGSTTSSAATQNQIRPLSNTTFVASRVAVLSGNARSSVAVETFNPGIGLFTRTLLDGLGGKAALNPAGQVTVSALAQYIEEQVARLGNGRQTPAVILPAKESDVPLTQP